MRKRSRTSLSLDGPAPRDGFACLLAEGLTPMRAVANRATADTVIQRMRPAGFACPAAPAGRHHPRGPRPSRRQGSPAGSTPSLSATTLSTLRVTIVARRDAWGAVSGPPPSATEKTPWHSSSRVGRTRPDGIKAAGWAVRLQHVRGSHAGLLASKPHRGDGRHRLGRVAGAEVEPGSGPGRGPTGPFVLPCCTAAFGELPIFSRTSKSEPIHGRPRNQAR